MAEDNEARKRRKTIFHYTGAVVLGMNDALVEMTGALAGFTIGLGENRLIIIAGVTTGVAATLSMACAEFLSDEVEASRGSSLVSAVLTGLAYLLVLVALLTPYVIFPHPWQALCMAFITAVLLLLAFTWCVARVRGIGFGGLFWKMLWISAGVAAVSFLISWGANVYWNIPV